jgi:cytochrome c oxidase subunit 3
MSATGHAIQTHHPAKTNTGWSNGLVGVMLFLVSEMALFGSLIFMYLYVRRAATLWPPIVPGTHHRYEFFDLTLPTINTIVLLSSGVTMHFAYQALRAGNMRRMLTLLILTIILGVGFLSGQAWEYKHVVDVNMTTNIYGATFFMLTGLHGLHVSGGVIFLLIILYRTLRGHFSQQNTMVPHAATLYWHFVDAVWVVLFALFYLTVQPF